MQAPFINIEKNAEEIQKVIFDEFQWVLWSVNKTVSSVLRSPIWLRYKYQWFNEKHENHLFELACNVSISGTTDS